MRKNPAPLKPPYKEQSYERLIQLGAALTEKPLPDWMATDDKGDSISSGNRQLKKDMGFKAYWDGACSADKIQKFTPMGMDSFVLGTTMLFGKCRP